MRDMSGTLGRNTRKTKDTHPDYSGSCVIDGKAYWMSGWPKKGERDPFIGLSFKPKDVVQQAPAAAPEFDDDLPF